MFEPLNGRIPARASPSWVAGSAQVGNGRARVNAQEGRAPSGAVMKFAAPAASTVKDFEALLPSAPGVTSKLMFGQPAAVVNGHLFFGVFGNQLFVRLSDADRSEAGEIPGFLPFEPMPGRAMREYLILRPGGGALPPARGPGSPAPCGMRPACPPRRRRLDRSSSRRGFPGGCVAARASPADRASREAARPAVASPTTRPQRSPPRRGRSRRRPTPTVADRETSTFPRSG